MDVKEAVTVAINHVRALFEHENISNLGLEEIEYEPSGKRWVVTVGFSRPWDYPHNALAALSGQSRPARSFKIVSINDNTGQVIAIKNHPTND